VRELKTFDLGDRGAGHIRKRLADLCSYKGPVQVFCAGLDEVIASRSGRAWTMAPTNTPLDRLYQFEWGGLLPENLDMSRGVATSGGVLVPIESVIDEERALVRTLLSGEPGRACIVVDTLLIKGDGRISEFYADTAFFVGTAVFHAIDGVSSERSVEYALAASPFWIDLRVVTLAPPKIEPDRESTTDELRKSAAAAIAISCSAYDGEGFVVWQPA
jgi:hypothetical protein